MAFDLPGTTRDAISVPFERAGKRFELIDTAGLRRKGRVFEAIEKFSVVKTLQAIESAHVVLLLLDATQGVTDQDAHIAGYALEIRKHSFYFSEKAARTVARLELHRSSSESGDLQDADTHADASST